MKLFAKVHGALSTCSVSIYFNPIFSLCRNGYGVCSLTFSYTYTLILVKRFYFYTLLHPPTYAHTMLKLYLHTHLYVMYGAV
jgi:hypothetical protein